MINAGESIRKCELFRNSCEREEPIWVARSHAKLRMTFSLVFSSFLRNDPVFQHATPSRVVLIFPEGMKLREGGGEGAHSATLLRRFISCIVEMREEWNLDEGRHANTDDSREP